MSVAQSRAPRAIQFAPALAERANPTNPAPVRRFPAPNSRRVASVAAQATEFAPAVTISIATGLMFQPAQPLASAPEFALRSALSLQLVAASKSARAWPSAWLSILQSSELQSALVWELVRASASQSDSELRLVLRWASVWEWELAMLVPPPLRSQQLALGSALFCVPSPAVTFRQALPFLRARTNRQLFLHL